MSELTKTQRTPEWYEARLGMFTASQIAVLMTPGDLSKNKFGDGATSYCYQLAGERVAREGWAALSPEQIGEYIRVTSSNSKEMQWGVDYEDAARMAFVLTTGKNVLTTGTCTDNERPYLSASPDGMLEDENALIEIKCPQFEKFARYSVEIKDGETLKAVNAKYYWQIQTQLYVTGRDFCYFVWYHPWFPLKWAKIERNDEDLAILLQRIDAANKIVENAIKSIKATQE